MSQNLGRQVVGGYTVQRGGLEMVAGKGLRTLVVRSLVGTGGMYAGFITVVVSQNLGRQVVGGYLSTLAVSRYITWLSQNLGRQVVGGYNLFQGGFPNHGRCLRTLVVRSLVGTHKHWPDDTHNSVSQNLGRQVVGGYNTLETGLVTLSVRCLRTLVVRSLVGTKVW